MRIAAFHNLPSGGGKRAFVEMLRQLRNAGDHIDVFVPSTAEETFLPSRPVADSVRVWKVRNPDGGLPSHCHGVPRLLGLARALRSREAAQRRMAAAIDAGAYDLVFVHHCRYTQSPSLLRYLRTPSAYYCAEPLRAAYERAARPTPRLEALRLFAPIVGVAARDRSNVARADRLLTNSFYSRESILRAYGVDASVVYLGVDTDRFRPAPRSTRRIEGGYVLSVGAIDAPKGHRLVVEALGRVPRSRRPKLVLVGDRAHAGEGLLLERLARSRDVELECRVRVSDVELVRLYQRARLLVCAQRLEPFGLVALEAAACGTPVVGIREAGLRESIVEDRTGVLVESRDARVLGEAVDALLADRPRWGRLSESAVETVRGEWTWQATGRRLRDELAAAARRSPAPGVGG